VLVFGRGAAGKSTTARCLGERTGLPVIELDQHCWWPGPVPTPPQECAQVQRAVAAGDRWIIDGDLRPYDEPSMRLGRADTVIILDFSLVRCAWRAVRRSRERADFWWWLLSWRHRHRTALLGAVATFAPGADTQILRTPRALRRFLATVAG